MVIFDTNILIELYRGNVAIKQSVEQFESNVIYLSSISVAEFLVGAKNKTDLAKVENQLSNYTTILMNSEISQIFMSLYRTFALSHRPGIAYTLIAATALYYDLPLYTLNKKHFQFVPGIQLI